MIGEVGLPYHEQPRQRAHQLVVDPQATHAVVRAGIDAHGRLERVIARRAALHLEHVAIALDERRRALAPHGAGEIEVHPPAP